MNRREYLTALGSISGGALVAGNVLASHSLTPVRVWYDINLTFDGSSYTIENISNVFLIDDEPHLPISMSIPDTDSTFDDTNHGLYEMSNRYYQLWFYDVVADFPSGSVTNDFTKNDQSRWYEFRAEATGLDTSSYTIDSVVPTEYEVIDVIEDSGSTMYGKKISNDKAYWISSDGTESIYSIGSGELSQISQQSERPDSSYNDFNAILNYKAGERFFVIDNDDNIVYFDLSNGGHQWTESAGGGSAIVPLKDDKFLFGSEVFGVDGKYGNISFGSEEYPVYTSDKQGNVYYHRGSYDSNTHGVGCYDIDGNHLWEDTDMTYRPNAQHIGSNGDTVIALEQESAGNPTGTVLKYEVGSELSRTTETQSVIDNLQSCSYVYVRENGDYLVDASNRQNYSGTVSQFGENSWETWLPISSYSWSSLTKSGIILIHPNMMYHVTKDGIEFDYAVGERRNPNSPFSMFGSDNFGQDNSGGHAWLTETSLNFQLERSGGDGFTNIYNQREARSFPQQETNKGLYYNPKSLITNELVGTEEGAENYVNPEGVNSSQEN